MDEFTTIDRFRALTCCSCRLAPSPSSENLAGSSSDQQRLWFEQSRPVSTIPVLGNWEDGDDRGNRREADLLSLHESGVEAGGSTIRRLRERRGNGDISGGGSGSGLSRWTLLKSWWSGGRGAVRLEDSDDEGEGNASTVRSDQAEEGDFSFDDNGMITSGAEDAVPLSLHSTFVPPPATISSSPSQSETTRTFEEDEREERRARRRLRRAARELGMSTAEYEDRLHMETEAAFLSSAVPSRHSNPHSQTSSFNSREPDSLLIDTSMPSNPNERYLLETEEVLDGGEEMFGSRRNRRRHREQGGSRGSRSVDGSQSTSDHRGSSNGSAGIGGEGRRRSSNTVLPQQQQQQHFLSPLPSDYSLPPSPSTSSSLYASSSQEIRRGHRHQQHPSVSSTSTSSSGLRKSRKQRSPLEVQTERFSEPSPVYYQDEFGQLQSLAGVESIEDGGQYYTEDATGRQVWISNSEMLAYQQQQQQLSHLPPPPSNDLSYFPTLPVNEFETSYDHIAPLVSPNAPTISLIPSEDSQPLSTTTNEVSISEVPVTSFLTQVDPLDFLRALKGTKLPPPSPEPEIDVPVILEVPVKKAEVEHEEEDDEEEVRTILGVWGGLHSKGTIEFNDELGDSTRWARGDDLSDEDDDEEEGY